LFPNEKPGNPGTPPHLKKYRKTTNAQPGKIVVHPGL
jgi:EF-hand domain-containing family member B